MFERICDSNIGMVMCEGVGLWNCSATGVVLFAVECDGKRMLATR